MADGALLYLDASALVKLVLPEAESASLVEFVRRPVDLVTSVVGRIETCRAVLRATESAEAGSRIEEVLAAVSLIDVTASIRRDAEARSPYGLRTLDAIHLATALSLGEELEVLIAYDARLLAAARDDGVEVFAPGAVF